MPASTASALDLLVAQDKITLVSTHDPILALLGHRRIVVSNGSVAGVIETSRDEVESRAHLERLDAVLVALRQHLRGGGRIAALPPVFAVFAADPTTDEPFSWTR